MINKIIEELEAKKYNDILIEHKRYNHAIDDAIEIIRKYDNTTTITCTLSEAFEIARRSENEENGWIEFELGHDEEREILVNPLPEDDEEVLITDGKNVWMTTFFNDGEECYFDDGSEFITEVIAWKKKPSPFVRKER